MSRQVSATDRWLRSNGFPSLADGGARGAGRGWVATVGLVVLWYLALQIPVVLVLTALLNSVQWAQSQLALLGLSLVSLALAALVVGFGIDKMAWFSIRWFLRLLARSSGRHLHLLPLLLVAVTFFFLGAETWQSVGRLTGVPLFLLSLLFTGLAVVFLVKRGESDPDRLDGFDSLAELRDALPAELQTAVDGLPDGPSEPVSLRFAQRVNLTIVSLLGRVLVAVAVGALVMLFFVVFGFIAVDLPTAKAWSTHEPTAWLAVTYADHTYSLTLEHVRVALFLGVFSSFYFIVSSASDTAMATSLAEDTDEHVRACLAVREVARRRSLLAAADESDTDEGSAYGGSSV